eukprot:TRINITY_DN26774_c0_g1_i1.p1 TRINITY_DN26774_c0_g1~~TRINITY_DN26774_c0_g1_i1.p1  ORF type:complete len:127 (-),score=18.48 TRINITY_DN26774_c0_g1_i1:97-477(-)
MIRRPPRSTQSRSSAASDVYKRQAQGNRATYRQARRQLRTTPPQGLRESRPSPCPPFQSAQKTRPQARVGRKGFPECEKIFTLCGRHGGLNDVLLFQLENMPHHIFRCVNLFGHTANGAPLVAVVG